MNVYFAAAKILDRLDAKQGSVKGLTGTLPDNIKKQATALVIETLKYKPVLIEIITSSRIMEVERNQLKSLNTTLVLAHDLLLRNGVRASDGPVKQAILRHKTRLHGELQKIKVKRGVKSNADLLPDGISGAARVPRYVRVNTNTWSMEEAIQSFSSSGYRFTQEVGESMETFSRDTHISDLLVFHPDASLIHHMAYQSGQIILQDKASCFPAVILAPPAVDNSIVIDATAAPGNKTSHLSALMQNKGKVYAFERDPQRFTTLEEMLSKAKARNVVAICADFLTVDPTDMRFSGVTHVLVDPSCSGSGIVNRLDHLVNAGGDSPDHRARLRKLSAFQVMMVRHAMKFPAVEKIVYSTCSVHAVENEHVVRDALRSPEARSGQFGLAPQSEVLPAWPRRGLDSELSDEVSALSLIRCCPVEDSTNGFFVACFVRSGDSRVNRIKRAPPPRERSNPKRKRQAT